MPLEREPPAPGRAGRWPAWSDGGRHRLPRRVALLACVLALTAGGVPPVAGAASPVAGAASPVAGAASPVAGAASPGSSAEALLDWIAGRPRRAGLAVYPGGAPLLYSADRRFPLASTRMTLILGAYAQAAGAGRLDPAEPVRVDAIERFYWPGADGGAHPQALEDWGARGVPQDGEVALDEVARAMIRWSDKAAADYLLDRVGRRAVARFARSHGMTRQQPLGPFFGEFLAWTATTPARWARRTPAARADVAWTLARLTTPQDAVRRPLPSVADQRRFAAAGPQGAPRDWARLMRDLMEGRALTPAAHAIVRRQLEWPLVAFPELSAIFTRLGSKGGSVPAALTEVAYTDAVGAPPAAVALFLRDLPPRLEAELARTFAQQDLVFRLAAEPELLARAREAFAAGERQRPH